MEKLIKYLLPYPTHLKMNVMDDTVIYWKPNEVKLYSDIVDEAVNSPTYNKPIVDELVKQGIICLLQKPGGAIPLVSVTVSYPIVHGKNIVKISIQSNSDGTITA